MPVSQWSALPHPGVGERGVAVLRVELQGDVGHVCRDPGHHGLHRLVPGDADVLERPRQEDHPVCNREGKGICLTSVQTSLTSRLQWVALILNVNSGL